MDTILVVIATVALILSFTALYVSAEFSAVKARHHRTHIGQMADAGNPFAKQLFPILIDQQKLDTYVAACQVGITISSLVLGEYGKRVVTPLAPVLAELSGLGENTVLVTLQMTALIFFTMLMMVIAELVPKSIAIQYPERVALWTVVPMRWSIFILRPFIALFNGSGNAILRLFNVNLSDEHGDTHSLDEIERMVSQTHEGGLINDPEQQMLRNAFRMRKLTARQVMVPRTKMVAAPATCTVDEVLALSIEGGYSRIPIYEETIDSVIGFVHVKDLFRQHLKGEATDLKTILRKVIHVPETLPIIGVWEILNEKRQYLVIVFDEHGGTEGMITFEDVIEEIFGELQDEFDENEMALISHDKEGRTHLRGDLLIADVNEYLNLDLPNDQADTLGGLVLSRLGRPATVGDEIKIKGLAIRVEAMSELGVSEVSFKLPDNAAPFTVGEWETTRYE